MLGWSSIQTRRTWISGRIIGSVVTNWLKMLVLGTNCENTRHFIVCQRACKISRKKDSGLRQTIGNIEFIHSSHKWLPTMLSCGQHGSALSTGWFVPRLRLCWRPRGLKVNFRKSLMYLLKPHICPHQLDVQETNVSIPQFHKIWKSSRWILYCEWMDFVLSTLWDAVIEVLRLTNNTERTIRLAPVNWCGTGDHSTNKTKIKTPTKNGNQSCARLVVRQNHFRSKDPNQVCWHQKPTRWHAHQSEFHARRVEPSSSFVQHHEFPDVFF